jgi:FAD/FMN-containing dehydrogenase
MTLTLRTLDGSDVILPVGAAAQLRSELSGELLAPDSPGYDEARAIWNAMIDRRPGLIARCRSEEDVTRAVRFAREHDLLLSIRGAGHNIAGNAVCEGGFMLDLTPMKAVAVDPAGRTARVQAGCTLADFDQAAQVHGLATPLGINSTTGVAGLALGGGYGWLSRRYGMTVDNLLSAEVVTPERGRLRASADENPDLFWAIRGGGGNFGVVTSFEFRLHPVGPEVVAGLIVHPFDDAPAVLRHYRDFVTDLPDETSVWVVMRKAPPLPFLPEEWHGKEIVVLAAFHAGDTAEGEAILEPLRRFGHPIADVIGPKPYAAWQQAFDPLLVPGARNYWKSHSFLRLEDRLLDTLVDSVGRLPTPQCEIFISRMGGAINRVPIAATAYPHREAEFIMNVHGRWDDAGDDDRCIRWARGLFDATAPYGTGGVYVNFMPADEGDRIRGAYGPNYDRLAALKNRYDPQNRLRMNQNIRPEPPAPEGPAVATPLHT